MRVFLEDLDEEIYKNRDKERYESVDRKERSIDTILGMSVTFKRRYYKDRKTGNYRFLLDEVLGLPKRSKQSPLAREIAIEMAVDGPSYRTASRSLERIFGGQVISHEGIRQNLIKVSDEAKVLLQREKKNKRPKENPGIIFIEEVYPDTQVPLGQEGRRFKYGQFGYGKYVYEKELMREMEESFRTAIGTLFPEGKILYFV
jgi:hypothetical protein